MLGKVFKIFRNPPSMGIFFFEPFPYKIYIMYPCFHDESNLVEIVWEGWEGDVSLQYVRTLLMRIGLGQCECWLLSQCLFPEYIIMAHKRHTNLKGLS